MAGQSALRRWTRLVSSFDHIDAAIEAADPTVSRDEFRRLRAQIVEMLCDAQDDDRKAEELCLILDGVMEESLATLQAVPADVVPKVLASSADLANAVGALRSHASERVRGLARDIIRGWKASVEGDIVSMTAATAKLDALLQLPPSESRAPYVFGGRSDDAPSSNPMKKKEEEGQPCTKKAVPLDVDAPRARTAGASAPRKTAPGISCATMADKQAPSVKMSESIPVKMDAFRSDNLHPEAKSHQTRVQFQGNPPHTKKMAPVVVGPNRVKAYEVSPLPEQPAPISSVRHGVRTENTIASTKVWSPEEKMEITKRKLHEGYQEAADAKRRRTIQVIEAPKMLEERRRKMHPIMRERSRARSGNPKAVGRSLHLSFH